MLQLVENRLDKFRYVQFEKSTLEKMDRVLDINVRGVFVALSTNKPFTLVQVGPLELKHRVVMAPLSPFRSPSPENVLTWHGVRDYIQCPPH